jgi:hypothetical protein
MRRLKLAIDTDLVGAGSRLFLQKSAVLQLLAYIADELDAGLLERGLHSVDVSPTRGAGFTFGD